MDGSGLRAERVIEAFLRYRFDCEASPNTLRAYAHDLKLFTPQQVWSVLSDRPGYADWHPFMPSASGTLADGQRLEIELRPPTGNGMRIRPAGVDDVRQPPASGSDQHLVTAGSRGL